MTGMNLFREALKKIGLPVAVLVLWILDDFMIFLPDAAVWALTRVVLNAFGKGDRVEALQAYWTGKVVNQTTTGG